MQKVGGATTLLAAPLAAGLAASAKSAIDFETAMAGAFKTTGIEAASAEADALSESILDMSLTIPLAATELAEITQAAGQLGIAREDLQKFTELTAKMATSFEMTAGEAGKSIAKLMNLYGVGVEGASDLGDAINTLGNNSSATESQIVDVMTRIGGLATGFGLAGDEAAALGTAFIAAGGTAETSGTAINSFLQALQTASTEGPKFQNALSRIGMTGEELEASIRENPMAAVTDFMQRLNQLDAQTRAFAIKEMFGKGGDTALISKLAGDTSLLTDAMDQATNATARAGSMQEEFNTKTGTSSSKIQLMSNRITKLRIKIGEALVPAMERALETLEPLIDKFTQFAESNPKIIIIATAIIGVVAALGLLLVMVGTVITAIGAIATVVTLPMVGIGLLVAALIAGAILVAANWERIKLFFQNLGTTLSNVWQNIKTAAINAFESMRASLANFVSGVQQRFAAFSAQAQAIWSRVKGFALAAVRGMVQAFQSGVGRVRSAMENVRNAVLNVLTNLVGSAMEAGRNVVSGIADGIRAGIGAVSSAASAVAAAVASKLPNSPVPEGPLTILNGTRGNTGYKIAEMIAGGLERGKSLMGEATGSAVTPVASVATVANSGGSNRSSGNTNTFSPNVSINVSGAGDPQAVAAEVKRQVAALFEQFNQQQAREDWLSYSA